MGSLGWAFIGDVAVGEGWEEEEGDVGSRWGEFIKEVVFKVDLESDFVILETKVNETVPFSWVGEEGNVI